MKKQDILSILFIGGIATIFLVPASLKVYHNLYSQYPVLLSFIKFALLATFGEMLVLRIKKGKYIEKEFGLLPKVIIWGFLGMIIYIAFVIFANGVPALLFKNIEIDTIGLKLANAFLISFFMNIIFAPVMMIFHNLTDLHIKNNNGKFPIKTFYPVELFKQIDWNRMWGFVLKKTIPFFWIPAHTITFMLPAEFRVLFAAFLSIILGLLLALGVKN